MKVFAIMWILVGAAMVAASIVFFLSNAAGPASRTMVITFACVGVPFVAFGVWGLYQELKPYRYQRRPPQQ